MCLARTARCRSVRALRTRVVGTTLEGLRLGNPFVLRTVEPTPQAVAGRAVGEVRRLGKRIVLALEGKLFVAIHLMIAGRLHWRPRGGALPRGRGLAALDFPVGTLLLTEAGRKRRAALHLIASEDGLAALDRGGVEVTDLAPTTFGAVLARENHTLKRALTDPSILSGIGNAYSDEILHRARLSPFRRTRDLGKEEMERLHGAAREVPAEWTERLATEAGDDFPEGGTAFREGMAVHGRFGHPCPVCGAPVQRVVYAENECNYCPACQTGGRILADRALSRLLRDAWPRNLEDLPRRAPAPAPPMPGGRRGRRR